MPYLPGLADEASLIDVFKTHPQVGAAIMMLNDAVMRQPAPFSPAEREAIAAYVSQINACQYCGALHADAATKLGMAQGDVAAICERPEAPPDPRLAPVLTYVAKLTTQPASVTQADVQRILDAGWDEDAVSFAAFVAGVYALMNRVVEGHGITIARDKVDAGGKRLTEIGYAGIARMLAGT
tara:strand:+ start:12753 stop:13298 length:546 start_codon:yes stop_codon:yes gene_type:complete